MEGRIYGSSNGAFRATRWAPKPKGSGEPARALPPLYFLHVWWARRPLTPSRAAVLASLAPADTDPGLFLRQLGIERVQALVHGEPWTLTGELLSKVRQDGPGTECLPVDARVHRALEAEDERRAQNRQLIASLKAKDNGLSQHPVLCRWEEESRPLPKPWPAVGQTLPVRRIPGDPAHVNERIDFARLNAVKTAIGREIRWAPEDLYAYDRSYNHPPQGHGETKTLLDPTAGGGSIPFEGLRLGHRVIANELNPVAATILSMPHWISQPGSAKILLRISSAGGANFSFTSRTGWTAWPLFLPCRVRK